MKQITFKKMSILGLALLATSAVVAAFTTRTTNKDKIAVNGTLKASPDTADTHTCVAASSGTLNCHNSASAGFEGGTSSGGGTASTTAQAGNTTTGDQD